MVLELSWQPYTSFVVRSKWNLTYYIKINVYLPRTILMFPLISPHRFSDIRLLVLDNINMSTPLYRGLWIISDLLSLTFEFKFHYFFLGFTLDFYNLWYYTQDEITREMLIPKNFYTFRVKSHKIVKITVYFTY